MKVHDAVTEQHGRNLIPVPEGRFGKRQCPVVDGFAVPAARKGGCAREHKPGIAINSRVPGLCTRQAARTAGRMDSVAQQSAARAENVEAEAESPEERARGRVQTPRVLNLAKGHGLATYAAWEVVSGRLRAADLDGGTETPRRGATLRVVNSNPEQEEFCALFRQAR